MEKEVTKKLAKSINEFKMPRYNELTNVGLYLEQTVKLINSYLYPLTKIELTTSMISNYVKKGIIESPIKKQYYAKHISKLIFIALTKIVASLDDIRLMIEVQDSSYEVDVAYDYFCEEFENVLQYTFGLKDSLNSVGRTKTNEKDLLRNAIITIVNKIYLDKYVEMFRLEQNKIHPSS